MTSPDRASTGAPAHAGSADLGGAWMRHMRAGDFESAWAVSDAVLAARGSRRCWARPRHEQWVWDGRPLTGKRVLVRCYHGLGDTIQFARFLPRLATVAREVIVWAQPPLVPLLDGIRGVARILPLHDGTPDVDHDADVEIMELGHVLRVTSDGVRCDVPYLHAPPAPIVRGPGRQVGIVWAAGGWDRDRSMTFADVAPLARVEGITWHVLQRGAPRAHVPAGWGVMSGSDDLQQAARVMKALDLVVTVDSMPAHLAGALGVPVWVLLKRHADWRWMDDHADSPWYPTMRLVRQERAGDWAAVVGRVARALESGR